MNGAHTHHTKSIFIGIDSPAHSHDRSAMDASNYSNIHMLSQFREQGKRAVKQFNHITVGHDINDISFEEIYSPIVPFFVRKDKPCECNDSLTSCKHIIALFEPQTIERMK